MTTKIIYSRVEIDSAFDATTWQKKIFNELATNFRSRSRLFPCTFGVAGFEADQLRFAFSENMDPGEVSSALKCYLKDAKSFGKNTSLLVLSRPGPIQSLEHYRARFWSTLDGIHQTDDTEWPETIPAQIDSAGWEWCFGGEQIFVVCNTPAHVNRQSRRFSSFMLTFQPRWVFNGILDTRETAEKATSKIRSRILQYDLINPSQDLGLYGDPDNREFAQYFLDDENRAATCPFHSFTKKNQNEEEKVA
ncbi:YqcI/YcgG family protein [Leisingera aquaemixtae]|uniref:YqcI/YcgG family protein n=1 Tax=Leisingera aquaemixtae TaxID=1396826 RepID=UPI0021A25E00|nr:YqcI/YcgG family protein [Leisingera aquaemixtae]UWQ36648.1 YqcI/YcgG family protein [Leisingera aquaemixtae]